MIPIYESILPNPELKPYIRRFLITDNQTSFDLTVNPTPTGYNYLGWVFRGDVIAHIDGEEIRTVKSMHLAGQITDKPFSINYRGKLGHVLAEFTAAGFYRLMHVPGDFVNARKRRFCVFTDQLAQTIPDQLSKYLSSGFDHVESLQQCLLGRIVYQKPAPHYIDKIAETLEVSRGLTRLSEIYENLGISERQATRNFNKIVGISPKGFAGFMRLNHALELLFLNKDDKLAVIAHKAGFYDQSHLIHVIQQFFGENPQQFLKNDRRLQRAFHTSTDQLHFDQQVEKEVVA